MRDRDMGCCGRRRWYLRQFRPADLSRIRNERTCFGHTLLLSMSDLLLIRYDVFLTIRCGGTPARRRTRRAALYSEAAILPHCPKKDRPPHAELLRNSDCGFRRA